MLQPAPVDLFDTHVVADIRFSPQNAQQAPGEQMARVPAPLVERCADCARMRLHSNASLFSKGTYNPTSGATSSASCIGAR